MQPFSSAAQACFPTGCVASNVNDLRARLDGATPAFVLIDPMLGEPLPGLASPTGSADPQSVREAIWHRAVTRIPLSAHVSLPQQQHPYLVALTGLDDALLDDTFEIANAERLAAQEDGLNGNGGATHRIGGWVQSTMHPEDLAAHLSTIFKVNTSAFTRASYMRLVDRRALALLRHIVGDARVCDQFGRLQRWTYLDTRGGLATLASASEAAVPLHLSVDEWRLMEQGEAIHRTTSQWLGELATAGEVAPSAPHEICGAVQLALAEAAQAARHWPHRFSELADRTAFAAICLLHSGVSTNTAVRALLSQHSTLDNPPEPLRFMYPEVRKLANADFESRSS